MNMSAQNFQKRYEKEVHQHLAKYDVLKDLDLFVLDNSIRESTVGQLRGHTLENKWEIYNEVKKCGFKNIIVASFSHMTRVDDVFVNELIEKGEDPAGLWAFSEITDAIEDMVPDTQTTPVGLLKTQKVGLRNVILEIDLADSAYNFKKVTMVKMCNLVEKWIGWIKKNLGPKAKILVNLRDPQDVMPTQSSRIFQLVEFLANLNSKYKLFGLIFEEQKGACLPEECATWAKYLRQLMTSKKWNGHLLFHVHEKFGLADATQLQALTGGANGIWASVCNEGASMGHASSCVTIINLIRLGNKTILKKYNCSYLRTAAINVTKITTGLQPHNKQPIYGDRAVDLVFSLARDQFDLARFFGETPPIRITSLSSPNMIVRRLEDLFGKDEQFTIGIANEMKQLMDDDMRMNRKEEYMSHVGLAMLFDRAGGHITVAMRDLIAQQALQRPHDIYLIEQIRKRWDEWDLKDVEQNDEKLQYDSFYKGFLAPYFACYRCHDTKKALQAIDMDKDGHVAWSELMVYIKWALHEYPDMKEAEEVLEVAFRKGLIPAMRDELVNNGGTTRKSLRYAKIVQG